MSNRGFVRGRSAAVCIVFAGSVAALSGPAAATGMWTGGYIGFKTDFTDVNIDYTNTGTPEQNLSGVTAGLTAGYDVEMGNIVLGVAGDVSMGNLTDFLRDGNYITESGKITALGAIRGRFGIDMGKFMPFVTGGVMITSLEQGEICPDPAAAPYGFCNHGFAPYNTSPGPFDLKQSKTLVGGTIGAGFEYMFASGWSMQAQYLHTFFPETSYVLAPDSDGNPLPESIAHPSLDQGSVSFIRRF